jgi:tRNA/rRNA methyltransferase
MQNTCVILINPQMPENIGAAARAALNFGITELRIVNPREGWPNDAAGRMSTGAIERMKVTVFDTVRDSFADLHYLYATTARDRDIQKPVFTAETAAADATTRIKQNQKIGFVFGPERTGLENDDLSLCHAILTIPTNPEFYSLNLSQCVNVVAYEMSKALALNPAPPPQPSPQWGEGVLRSPKGEAGRVGGESFASFEKIDEALTRLENELESAGFFKTEEIKPTMKRNLRAMFLRAEWTDQETRTFQGILSALTRRRGN